MAEPCCPPFEPEHWDEKTLTWTQKKFARDKVACFFYMPIGFGRTMKRLMSKLERAKAECPDWVCLSDHTSKWNMDVYLAVDRDVPDAEMSVLDGRFVSKVYEGPFRDTGKWCADFAQYVRRQGVETDKLYMWYTTCPKCAKERGKNYVVVLGQVKSTQPGAPSS
ncbi:MAG: hypothetical protein JW940_20735 [Polyangiaceae bacterium]|nr:hypothetical protein [Polyangiaceae bacterium]